VLAPFGWGRIFDRYEVMFPVEPSAVVELIRAAPMAMRDGPFAGMESIDAQGSSLKKIGATRHR
jgi:predicted RNA polymerase sigma factor